MNKPLSLKKLICSISMVMKDFFIPIVIEGALNLDNIDSKNLNCISLEKRIHGLPRRYEKLDCFKSAKPTEEILMCVEKARQ